jgi:Lamin Tail Domain
MSNQGIKIREILVVGHPPGEEYVKIHHGGSKDVDLTGWVLRHSLKHGDHKFTFKFPPVVMSPNDLLTIHMRSGTNDADIYFGISIGRYGTILVTRPNSSMQTAR